MTRMIDVLEFTLRGTKTTKLWGNFFRIQSDLVGARSVTRKNYKELTERSLIIFFYFNHNMSYTLCVIY